MNKISTILFAAAAAAMMTSCVKDELFDTPHPAAGALIVTAEWGSRSSNADIPQEYTVRIGSAEQTMTGETNTFGALLEPGSQQMLVYNNPAGITISGDIATVDADSRADDCVHPHPEFLFRHATDILVAADDTLHVTAPMAQYVRTLYIELSVDGGDASRVSHVSGTLEGVESSINLLTGERLAQGATVVDDYTVEANKMTLTYHLLGVHPQTTQRLTTHIEFTNGDTQTVISDLTDRLGDFHDDVEPLRLTARLNLPAQPGMTATIGDWQPMGGSNVDAH